MEVISKINNNAAVCLDSAGRELIAIGTGIGFPKVPYTLNDLDVIQQTYYGVNEMYVDLLNQIPDEIFKVSSMIVEHFRNTIDTTISSNLVFTLADHINFAIEREKKHLVIENPLQYEIRHLYEDVYDIGVFAVKLIKKQLHVSLPKAEISNIALHLINAEALGSSIPKSDHEEELLEEITQIIGEYFHIYIDKSSVSYSRFVSHMKYLMKRENIQSQLSSDNQQIYQTVIEQYPDTYACVKNISAYLQDECDLSLNDEEILYLVLHVNRLCVREDCYRKGITPAQEKE